MINFISNNITSVISRISHALPNKIHTLSTAVSNDPEVSAISFLALLCTDNLAQSFIKVPSQSYKKVVIYNKAVLLTALFAEAYMLKMVLTMSNMAVPPIVTT